MLQNEISGLLFILVLHMYIWMKWAKTDYYRSLKNIKFFSFSTRMLDFITTLIITLWSVKVVDYYHPEGFLRILIDLLAVGIIVYYRVFSLPKKNS